MSQTNELRLTIAGMDCAGCARSIESGVAQLAGVTSCELNFATETLRVAGAIDRATVVGRVRELGYDVAEAPTPGDAAPQTAAERPTFLGYLRGRRETSLTAIGALLALPGLIGHELLGVRGGWIDWCSIAALLLAGMPVARSAWRAVTVSRELNINVLMTIAAIGAVIIGAPTEAAMVMVLFALGEALEGYTAARARHAVRSMLDLVPERAVRLRRRSEASDQENPAARSAAADQIEILVSELQVGDRVLLRPGERLAVDGAIAVGEASLDQSPITGESMPVSKRVGDEVYAGSINGASAIEIEVTRPAADSTIARMVRLVTEAQELRAPTERQIDGFAKIYTPAVVAIAALVATVPPLLLGQPFWNPTPETSGWLYRALTLLVVACPCALVISTPVTIISALSAAARRGVLIKGGAALEALGRVRAVALDKTGTLTSGRPTVTAVRAADCADPGHADACLACDDLLALAATIERRSEHPLAAAVIAAAERRAVLGRYPQAEGVTALVGHGVRGSVAGHEVLLASHAHFDAALAHSAEQCAAASRDAASGATPVLISRDNVYAGTIAIADTLRQSSAAAIAELRAAGCHVAMLTGDGRATAAAIAASAAIDDVRAELLPEHKVDAIRQLTARYGPVAMVGDGINDAAALATASIGIAIGAAHGGSNQAMESAAVALLSDDLRQLPFAIRLSRAAARAVRHNIALSIGIKIAFLALVLLGMGSMWLAVVADVGTSLLVTLLGMRLLRYGGAAA